VRGGAMKPGRVRRNINGKSSARRNREPLQQQETEIANLEGCCDDSYLKRDPSCRDFPRESDARQNR